MDPRIIARIAYAAARSYAETQGDMTRKPWLELEPWQRTSWTRQAEVILLLADAGAAELHVAYVRERSLLGWHFGPTFDLALKTDPLMAPWERLTPFTRREDEMVVALVRALARDVR